MENKCPYEDCGSENLQLVEQPPFHHAVYKCLDCKRESYLMPDKRLATRKDFFELREEFR